MVHFLPNPFLDYHHRSNEWIRLDYLRMNRVAVSLLVFSVAAIASVSAGTNRAKVCQKAVNLGVTFYTASELEPILSCAETAWYTNPNDTTTIISDAKTCVINNSLNKALSALSLYNGFNGCTDLMALLDKLTTPFLNQCKQVINKATSNACMNKVYGQCIAIVTKAFVNKVCTALSKKMTSTEWNCCKTYAVKVVNVAAYSCYNIVK
ncbi:unnamed protein product [Caenorhabditis sp. 36 PRJEB53466]|nr:unnamed protein product [Caenorhabditis sp. 36 PRJEB53466]